MPEGTDPGTGNTWFKHHCPFPLHHELSNSLHKPSAEEAICKSLTAYNSMRKADTEWCGLKRNTHNWIDFILFLNQPLSSGTTIILDIESIFQKGIYFLLTFQSEKKKIAELNSRLEYSRVRAYHTSGRLS